MMDGKILLTSFRKKESHLLKGHSRFCPFIFLFVQKAHLSLLISPDYRFGARLVSIKENNKFRETANEDLNEAPSGLKDFVSDIKRTFGLKYDL